MGFFSLSTGILTKPHYAIREKFHTVSLYPSRRRPQDAADDSFHPPVESSRAQKDRQRVGYYQMVSAIRGHSPYFITRCVILYQRQHQLSPALCLPCFNPGRENTSSQQNIYVSLQVQFIFFLGFQLINSTLILILSPTCLYKAGFRTNSCISFASFTVMFSSIL